MNRINSCFEQLKQQGRKALVTYIVNGDPSRDATLPAMHALAAAGADLIELGVPFSDPMADGPVIQLGHERALVSHTSLRDSFALVREFRQSNSHTPVVLMGYANPIVRMGFAETAQAAAEAGVDGLLTVDLPPEEAGELTRELRARGLDAIFLLAPTSTQARMAQVAEAAGGFLYYVSLKGVTGAGHLDVASVTDKLAQVRAHCALPLCVGFGIKDAASAQAVGRVADGVVVGSLLVARMGELAGQPPHAIAAALAELVRPLRAALDSI